MAANVEFHALLTRLDMSQETAVEVRQCSIDMLEKIGRVDVKQLRTSLLNIIAVIWLSATTVDNVVALRAWVQQNIMTRAPNAGPENFVDATLNSTLEKIVELEAIKKSLDDQDIPKPPKLSVIGEGFGNPRRDILRRFGVQQTYHCHMSSARRK
jgi:hypothetical protein